MNSLKDVYIDQLQDLYSADRQSAKITESLAEAASHPELKAALLDGVKGIRQGMEQIESLIRAHDADPRGEHCKGMEGLVAEAKAHALDTEFGSDEARDAMIVTQYQRMAHYAIAGYGCLVTFARRLDFDDQATTLEECLDACYDGDRRMTAIATAEINAAAV